MVGFSTLATVGLLAGLPSATSYGLFESVLLEEAATSTGARCLDGSPQRYWLQKPGKGAPLKWSIHLMGGGWCTSLEDCAKRAYDTVCIRGSSDPKCYDAANNPGNSVPGVNFSNPMQATLIPSFLGARWGGGLMNDNATTNPLTAEWGKVWIQYCDGLSFLGNNDSVAWVDYEGERRPLYFRGWRNWEAVIDDLIKNRGMGSAREVILSGDSAGGWAAFHHVDYLAERFPKARVVAAPDGGFVIADPATTVFMDLYRWATEAQNATLNSACTKAQTSAGKDYKDCFHPEVVAPYIATPFFVVNSRFDPVLAQSSSEQVDNVTNTRRLGAAFMKFLRTQVLSDPKNGAFVTACHQHCGQWAQRQTGLWADFGIQIDGDTAVTALAAWYKGGQRRVWVQEGRHPCPSCCNNLQLDEESLLV